MNFHLRTLTETYLYDIIDNEKIKGAERKMAENAKKTKHKFLKIIAVLFGIFLILAVISFPLKTVYYTINSPKITENVRVAQISDLHSCYYGKDMKTLLDALDNAAPDIVTLTGDIYDDIADNDNTRIFLKSAAKKYPCFYVAGNHENRLGERAKYRREMESYGITVLEGDNVTVGEITVCGAADSSDGSLSFSASVKKCAENASEDSFNLLLAHYPENIEYYLSFNKFDLTLSGHSHGGQWRIPGILNGLLSPGEGLFPKYVGGPYHFDNGDMIISRGLSRTKEIVPRIFNNPELVIVDICPERS